MAMNTAKQIGAAAIIGAALLAAGAVQAQTRTNWIGTVGVEAAWDQGNLGAGEGVNWLSATSENFQPDRTFGGIGEYGSISNGGIALVDHAITVSPTDIRLAQDAASTGTLVIRNGGSITVQEASGGDGDGAIANGFAGGGAGRLVLRDNIGAVNVQRYSQTAPSTLVAQLGSGSSFTNPVQVSTQIVLGGTLRVERTPGSGFVASGGNMWTLFQGAPATGAFSTIDVDPALKSNAGQVFSVSTAGNAVKLSVDQRLVLEVDRFTGAANLRNPTGHATNISLIGYTLSSVTTPLESSNARWKSFADDAGKPGWFEANPTATNLSELSPTGSLTMNPGVSHDFGTPFTADTNAPLGTDRVNVGGASFNYQLPNGTQVDAAVEAVGRFNDLVLVVNPTTGSTLIQNQSGQSIEFISYTISSASGVLLPGYAGSGRPNWFKANPTVNNLSELSTISSIALGAGGEVDLGLAWNTAGQQDLTFAYQLPTGTLLPGTVHFGAKAVISVGLLGDYNGNGVVDAADYVVWRNTLGTNVSNGTGADGSGNGVIDTADYGVWRAQFGSVAGAAAGVGTALSHAAPEPPACLLALVGMLLASVGRVRGRA